MALIRRYLNYTEKSTSPDKYFIISQNEIFSEGLIKIFFPERFRRIFFDIVAIFQNYTEGSISLYEKMEDFILQKTIL